MAKRRTKRAVAPAARTPVGPLQRMADRRAAEAVHAPVVSPEAAAHGDYREARVVDLSGELGGGRMRQYRVMRNHAATTVDRWLDEGGPGFEEPSRRAIDHVRSLWALSGHVGRLVANLSAVGVGSGAPGSYERGTTAQIEALTQLALYRREFPPYVWDTFEAVVRWDEPAGTAGSKLARNPAQQQAHAKACVGFVAAKIAEWRGY